jgi:hypothetical protein
MCKYAIVNLQSQGTEADMSNVDAKSHLGDSDPNPSIARKAESSPTDTLKLPAGDDMCTNSLFQFLWRHNEIFDLLAFGAYLAKTSDLAMVIIAQDFTALSEEQRNETIKRLGLSDDQVRLFLEAAGKSDLHIKHLQRLGYLQIENVTIRMVDNFLCFLSDTIQSCMKKRPEMLRSSETVKIEDVLKFSSLAGC